MAGLPRIEVKFLIDANGILHVSAREQRSGKEAEVEVKPTYGLTDEQVETMILDSFDHAEADIEERQVIEASNEAETILAAVEKGKTHAAWQMLSADEIAAIEQGEAELRASLQGRDYKLIRQSIETLDKATRRFAELMMDTAVAGAMKGKTMQSAGETMGEGPTAPHPFAKAQIDSSNSIKLETSEYSTRLRENRQKRFESCLRAKMHAVDLSKPAGEGMVRVTFEPEGKTVEFPFDSLPYEGHGLPMSFLDVAENYGIFLDHACGGVCACTTCHIWVKEGAKGISEAEDLELDRMETAADIQLNSRLGCQAVIERPGTYVVEIPKWNRNYVQEGKPAHGPGA